MRSGSRHTGRGRDRGFTLIEVLVSIMILAVIGLIVFLSFSSVSNATLLAQDAAERLRLQQFLMRHMQESLSTVYSDPGFMNEQCQFIGTNGDGASGPADSLEFCSSSPMLGGLSAPGLLKRISYTVVDAPDSGTDLDRPGVDPEKGPQSQLEAREMQLLEPASYLDTSEAGWGGGSGGGGGVRSGGSKSGSVSRSFSLPDGFSGDDEIGTDEQDNPGWSVPLRSMDLAYFDGQDWLDDWDSLAIGRMPWCVRVRIDFEEPDDSQMSLSGEGAADLEMFIPIPLGAGVLTDATTWRDMVLSTSGGSAGMPNQGTGKNPVNTTGQQGAQQQNLRENLQQIIQDNMGRIKQ